MLNQVYKIGLIGLLSLTGLYLSPHVNAQPIFSSELQTAKTTPLQEFRIAPFANFSRERFQTEDTVSSIGFGLNFTYGLRENSALRFRYASSASAVDSLVYIFNSFELGYTHSFWNKSLALSLPFGAAYADYDYWVFTASPSLIYTYNLPSIDCDAYAGFKLPIAYTNQLFIEQPMLNIGMSYLPPSSRLGARFEAGINTGAWRISHKIHQAAFSIFWRINKAQANKTNTL